MKEFNLAAISNNTSLEKYKNLLTTQENADIVITGLLEKHSNNISDMVKVLTEIKSYTPKQVWFEYFFRCCKYASSYEEFQEAIEMAEEIICEVKPRKYSSNLFVEIEDLYIRCNYIFTNSNLLRNAAERAYRLWNDVRYRLFRDFAFVYTSTNKNELENAVYNLSRYLKSKVCKEDRRCIFYLICLTLVKLATLKDSKYIYNYTLDRIYSDCICYYDQEALSKGYDSWNSNNNCFDVLKKAKKYNCPEIIRLQFMTNASFDIDFANSLSDTVNTVLEENQYSSERTPIIRTNLSFCRNTD